MTRHVFDFPSKFCVTRWIENGNVAIKFLKVFDAAKKFITKAKDTRKPSLMSWQRLRNGFKYPFMKAKINFFVSVSNEVEPFPKKHKTNFLCYHSCMVIYWILFSSFSSDLLFLKTRKNNFRQLSNLDLDDKENFLLAFKVKVGLGTLRELNELKKSKDPLISERVIEQVFKNECQVVLREMGKKILERSPLKYNIVR